MKQLQILGSCSGTEPQPFRHHTSVTLTVGESLYFFDAGETCSRLAHLAGSDLLHTRAIFLSHTHYDHIGGLGGLFWNVRKLCSVKKRAPLFSQIRLFLPETEAWEGIRTMLSYTEGGFGKLKFSIDAQRPVPGLFYEDENISVRAFPSGHLPPREDGLCRSFCYRILLGETDIVYSGDVGSVADLIDAVGDGCDLLMMETGHHTVADVCRFAREHGVKKLLFYHHGREILSVAPTVAEAISHCGIPVVIAEDGTRIDL